MDIRARVMSALRWSAAARFLGQLFSWTVTILVIRQLSPGDYGLMAMSMVVVSFLILLNTLGLDAVLVQQKNLPEQARRQVFTLVIVTNLVFFVLLLCAAPWIAEFYGEPRLVLILQVLSLQFPLLIFETLPQSALERDIEFAGRSVVELLTMVLGSVCTLMMALAGYGVWALVWGTLVSNAARMIGLNLICRNLVWPSLSLKGMGRHVTFGGLVSTDRGLWYIFSESDKFIGGKMLGHHQLGYYAVAMQLASLPIQKISGLLNAVAFPAFSRAHDQERPEQLRRYLLKATRLLGLMAFPVFFGMSCTATPIIATLLGDKWLPAAPLLQLLGIVMPFRLLANVFSPLLWGVGRPGVSASNLLLAALFMPLAFYAGSRYGVIGLAYAWLCAYPFVFMVSAYRTCAVVGLRSVSYFAQLLRTLAAGSIMYATVHFVQPFVYGSSGEWLYLLQLIATGALVYVFAAFVIDRHGVMQARELLRR